MTSLPNLILSFAVVGAVITLLTRRHVKNYMWSFLQNFTGVWFIFSGIVKAIDPIGTAYKMEDYFREFENTFAGLQNWFANLAPMFPALTKYAEGFSIFMIVLEIALGLMLILGYSRRWTAWLFFLIVAFFTVLTGFTYGTGYVPSEANFFDFAKWGPYVKTQMRVTDCGCFGDFIKLSPKTSFFKDLGLMIPALLFLFRSKNMHELLTPGRRRLWVWVTAGVSLAFCMYNTYWNNPVVDFRPFAEGNNIRERKALEAEARANVQIQGYVLENAAKGEVVTYMEPDPAKPYSYLKQYAKADGWKVKDQIKSDPYVEKDGQKVLITETKVSDFAVEDGENGEVTEDILEEKGYSLMIVAYHLEGEKQIETITVQDTVWAADTLRIGKDSMSITRHIAGTTPRQIEREVFVPEAHYGDLFSKSVNPIAAAAQEAKWKVYAISTYADAKSALDLKTKTGATYPFYKADDKLLKTITRSNPGLVVLKDGVVLAQYHWRHLPTPTDLVARFR